MELRQFFRGAAHLNNVGIISDRCHVNCKRYENLRICLHPTGHAENMIVHKERKYGVLDFIVP